MAEYVIRTRLCVKILSGGRHAPMRCLIFGSWKLYGNIYQEI